MPALPAPGPDQTRAGPATGDDLEAVDVPPHSLVKSPLTRVRGKIRGRLGGRMGETQGSNQAGLRENGE
ncbi:MAG: hypothetical protein OXM00_03295 [Paracoccaceae bacterium]|nr:hypothetical protein [Paracoccaceae bacterium]